MIYPPGSCMFLHPVGDEYSSFDTASAEDYIENVGCFALDPKVFCEWMYNSKTLTVRRQNTSEENPQDGTTTYHRVNPSLVEATTHPFPVNFLDPAYYPNVTAGIPFLSNEGFPLLFFIHLGIWYGVMISNSPDSSDTYSAFTDTSITQTNVYEGSDGPDGETITTVTITEKFYP